MTETTPQYSLKDISSDYSRRFFPSLSLTKEDTSRNIAARRRRGRISGEVFEQIIAEGLTFLFACAIRHDIPIFTPLERENTDVILRRAFRDCINNSIINYKAALSAQGQNPDGDPTVRNMKQYSEMLFEDSQTSPLSSRR